MLSLLVGFVTFYILIHHKNRIQELNLKLKDCNNLESDILTNEIDTLESILGHLSELNMEIKHAL